jgi:hypothetical protein
MQICGRSRHPVRNAGQPRRWSWPLGCWVLGLATAFYPTLLSGFAKVQGDLGDSRLVNFVLEHGYRWLTAKPLAESLSSPPIFHPARGTAFYTDLMLGFAPLYWPWRWLGATPETAYQLWMILCWSLNFLACYLLLRRGLRSTELGAAVGAFLFAFASARMANIVHLQLVPQFFLLATLIAAVELLRTAENEHNSLRSRLMIGVLFGGLLLQLVSSVYPLVFFTAAAAAALAAALARRQDRRALAALLLRHWPTLAAAAAIALVLAAPVILRYWRTADELGFRPYAVGKLPRPLSWLLMGKLNLVYGWLHELPALAWAGRSPHHNGVGLLSLAAAVIGLWQGRRNRLVQLVLIGTAALFLLTLRMPGDWSLWQWAREILPGAAALRAVARVGMMGLVPAAIGIAIFSDRLAERRGRWLVALLALLVAAEQLHRPWTYDKAAVERRIEATAALVPADADGFLLVTSGETVDPHVHDVAAWTALAAGVPTVNGRSGNRPQEWRLGRVAIRSQEDRRRIERALGSWVEDHGLDGEGIAWIEVEPGPRRMP